MTEFISDAYLLGHQACYRGDAIWSNPYDDQDVQYEEWREGYIYLRNLIEELIY